MKPCCGQMVGRHIVRTAMDRNLVVAVLRRLSMGLTLTVLVIAVLTTALLGSPVSAERQTAGDNRGALGTVNESGRHVVTTPSASLQVVAGDFPQARTEPTTDSMEGAETASVQGTQHTDAMTIVARVNGVSNHNCQVHGDTNAHLSVPRVDARCGFAHCAR